MSALDDFMSVLQGTLKETGRELKVSVSDLRQRAAEQMAQLALAAGEPGYDRAVIAARDNVLLLAGIESVERADAVDNRIIGVVQAGLFMGAKVLAGGGSGA